MCMGVDVWVSKHVSALPSAAHNGIAQQIHSVCVCVCGHVCLQVYSTYSVRETDWHIHVQVPKYFST